MFYSPALSYFLENQLQEQSVYPLLSLDYTGSPGPSLGTGKMLAPAYREIRMQMLSKSKHTYTRVCAVCVASHC